MLRATTTDSETFDTGERVDVSGRAVTHVQFAHIGRYRWAAPQVTGRILDVACGTGYGMRMLRGRVSGLDAHAGAIAFARSQGLDARQATLPPIPFPDAEFDAVVTFETIEHIEDDAVYVAEIWRVLKPGGVLLLSTPNKDTSSPEGPPSNPWHRREYRLDDLRRLLATFANVEVYGQGFIPTPRVARQATRLTSRFPVLCPYLWRVAGLGNVVRWDGQFTPSIWALHATKPL